MVSSAAMAVRLNHHHVMEHGHEGAGAELEVEPERHVHEDGHHGVQQRHDAAVAQLLADLRAHVLRAAHLEVRLVALHALHQRAADAVRHAADDGLVVEAARLRLAQLAHLLHARAGALHRLVDLLAGERLLGAEVDDAVGQVRGDPLERPQRLEGLLGVHRALLGELGDTAQAQQERVLVRRADALHRDVVQRTGLGALAHLGRADGVVELDLHHRAAGEVHAEVEPEDGDAHEDEQVDGGGDEDGQLALADEVDVRLVLDDLHLRTPGT
jgi:hypothetical protein